MTTTRWKQRPVGSNWGDFGPDDQLGSMNLVGPAQVVKGIEQARAGLNFCLSLPLDYPGGTALHPRRQPPRRFATLRGGKNEGEQCFCFALSRENPFYSDVYCDDVVVLHTQYSTQWDGLAHVGSEFDADADGKDEIVFYNGYRGGRQIVAGRRTEGVVSWDSYEDPTARALGIENLARHGVQGRAVMIDLQSRYGLQNYAVGYEDLMQILDQDGIVIERGDMVCLHTGLDDLIMGMRGEPDGQILLNACAGLNGADQRLLDWITNTGIAALISDNFAIELMPKGMRTESKHAMLPLHEHCLFKNGIHLGELWRLGELKRWLRQNGRSQFLLTAPPLFLNGAVGSPVTPVATV